MTLAKVAAKLRRGDGLSPKLQQGCLIAINNFESDPDFTLRARVEALAEELKKVKTGGRLKAAQLDIARRLREVLR